MVSDDPATDGGTVTAADSPGSVGGGGVGVADRLVGAIRPNFFRVVVVLTLLFFYAPVLLIAYFSVGTTAQPTFPIDGVTLRWYEAVLSDRRFVRGLVTSTGIAVVVAVVGTALGAMAARSIVRSSLSRRVRGLLAAVIALPLFVPTVVLALGIGVFAGRIGLGFGLGPILLGHLLWVLPFSTFLLTARYAELDPRLTGAARDLGATDWVAFRTVTLPLLAPALVASTLFCFALSFNEFLITYFLAGSGVTTMPLEIFDNVRTARVSVLNAASTLVLLVSAVVAVVATRFETPT